MRVRVYLQKPLLLIHGRPMILHCGRPSEKKSKDLMILCVATDDQRIAEVCRAEGVDVVLTSADHPSGTDRLRKSLVSKVGHKTILL